MEVPFECRVWTHAARSNSYYTRLLKSYYLLSFLLSISLLGVLLVAFSHSMCQYLFFPPRRCVLGSLSFAELIASRALNR